MMHLVILVLGISLAVFAVLDVKYQEIPVVPVFVLGVGILGVRLWSGATLAELLLGLLPGVFLLLLSVFSQGGIGIGDGLLLLVIGLGNGLETTILILWIAFFTGGVYAASLLLLKKAGRKTSFPFLPFLLLGYLSGVVWIG